MSKWEMVKLGDICFDMHQGINTVADEVAYQGNGVPIIQSKNITKGYLDLDDVRYVDDNDYKKYNAKYNPRIGDLLICNIGTIGKSYTIVKEDKFLIAWNLFIVKLKVDMVIPQYVQHYLNYLYSINYFDRLLTGGTVKFINKSKMSNIGIPIPPLDVQKHIADVLDKAQEIIDGHNKQLEELDNLIKAIFYDMFGDPIINEKEWESITLKDVILDIRYGTSTPPVFSENGYKFIRATNIKNGRIIEDDMKFISHDEGTKIEKCKMKGNEMIIVRSGVNAGDTCVISEDYIGHYAGYDLILEFNQERVSPFFINELFNTNYMENAIKPLTRRAAQPHLNSEQVQSLQIVLPPLELQKKYITIIQNIEEQKSIVKRSLKESHNLFISLMSKYFD